MSLVQLIKPTLADCRAFAKDRNEKLIFVNTRPQEITAFGNLEGEAPEEKFKIENISGDRLIAMKTMFNNRLITLSKDGHLNLYTYTETSGELISMLNMNYGRPAKLIETYVALGVSDNYTDYIVLSTKRQSKMAKFVLLSIDESNNFSCLSSHMYKKTGKGSKVYDLGIRAKDKEMPIVYGFMNDGQRKLLILGIINQSLYPLDDYPNFHKDKHGASELLDGFLYAVEATGTLRIVEL